jgi:dienelactone hydrolase
MFTIRSKIFSPDGVINQKGVIVFTGIFHVSDQVLGDFKDFV